MLLLAAKVKKATFAVTLMIADAQLRKGCGRLLWQPLLPPPQKSNSLNRKPSKRTLKKCDKDAEVGAPQLMVSGRGAGGGLSSIKGLATESLTMLQ